MSSLQAVIWKFHCEPAQSQRQREISGWMRLLKCVLFNDLNHLNYLNFKCSNCDLKVLLWTRHRVRDKERSQGLSGWIRLLKFLLCLLINDLADFKCSNCDLKVSLLTGTESDTKRDFRLDQALKTCTMLWIFKSAEIFHMIL